MSFSTFGLCWGAQSRVVLKAFLYFELIRLYKIGFNVEERKYKQPDTYIRYWLNVRYLETNQNELGPKSG